MDRTGLILTKADMLKELRSGSTHAIQLVKWTVLVGVLDLILAFVLKAAGINTKISTKSKFSEKTVSNNE